MAVYGRRATEPDAVSEKVLKGYASRVSNGDRRMCRGQRGNLSANEVTTDFQFLAVAVAHDM